MDKKFRLASLMLVIAMVLVLAGCVVKDTDPQNAAYVTLTVEAAPGKAADGSLIAAKALEIPAEGTTVGDVIKSVHEKWFTDGEAGYSTSAGQYGDMITKLWGIENGGSYGYYINGAMAMGLTDPVKPGDIIDVFVYKDAAGYSDIYTHLTAEANGAEVTVTVNAVTGFDANYNPVFGPLAGTKVCYIGSTGNLVDTGIVTGEDGTASITLKNGIYRIIGINTNGVYTISAQKITVNK